MRSLTSILLPAACVFALVSAQCVQEFEETVCADFAFAPDLILDGASAKLTIRNASGTIIHENFSKLDRVAEIKITESRIAKIEPGALCCTPNLTSLTLTANAHFPSIDKTTLQACHALKKFVVSGVADISKGAFADNKNLQSLSINATNISNLDAGICVDLPTLSFLSIQNSGIRSIGSGSFRGLKNLRILDLQNNRIDAIDADAFRNLTRLKVLNLSDNKLKNLTWREFDNLYNLRVLFMERNDFDAVDVNSLVAGVPDLERIFLSYDRLRPENRAELEAELPKANITLIYVGKPYESV